jgi:Flp pilus assembly secretin CpaC
MGIPTMAVSKLASIAVTAIAAVSAIIIDYAFAAEPRADVMRVISSSAGSRSVLLGLDKSVVIELPADIKDVLISNPKIANAVARSKRRVYIIGTAVGSTNIFFFDENGRQIGGLDVGVSSDQQLSPPQLENSTIGTNSVTIYRGMDHLSQECTQTACTQPPNPPPGAPSVNSTATTIAKDATGKTVGSSTLTGTTTAP